MLLAFTKKAVEEMEKRIEDVLGVSINIKTFHSLGYEVLSQKQKARQEIAFTEDNGRELYNFIQGAIERKLNDDADFLGNVYRFFKYHIDNYKQKESKGDLITINEERVRSHQELVIANFLAVNNINYIYEQDYEVITATESRKQYKPDFYLPDYRVYIEHFAVNRNNDPPAAWPTRQRNEYLNGMIWKREIHRQNNTTLLETYSWEFKENNFTERFTKKLREFRIRIDENPTIEGIYQSAGDQNLFYRIFTVLLVTFLSLYKSNNYTISKLIANKDRVNPEKALCFISCFEKIYNEYQAHLNSLNMIDFSDMIRQSTALLNNQQVTYTYDYILVDEFQDISYGRYELLRSFRVHNPMVKIFCVGDDWQSIFRFTGSDINLFFSFEDYFGLLSAFIFWAGIISLLIITGQSFPR